MGLLLRASWLNVAPVKTSLKCSKSVLNDLKMPQSFRKTCRY
ncbi:hypothetical protein PF002_g31922 [Phytophthora fragariae]|uniref:Uncharacterized protein n=1 Tax=Phytophthora fragariae TaxID=53985 RepID=A0A6A3VDA1_9STRA|nr:hypothetical protein PF002_g31922 [Phytophthora fragariae]